jgi:tetratricopeptide (TPR) repeat protein
MADETQETSQRAALRKEALDCNRKGLEADLKDATAWNNLGAALGKMAHETQESSQRAALRKEELVCHRKAVEVDPKSGDAWSNLAAVLGGEFRKTKEPETIAEAVNAAHQAVALGEGHYNLSCCLALAGSLEEALRELTTSLERGVITVSHVANDPDWEAFRNDERFQTVLRNAVKTTDPKTN